MSQLLRISLLSTDSPSENTYCSAVIKRYKSNETAIHQRSQVIDSRSQVTGEKGAEGVNKLKQVALSLVLNNTRELAERIKLDMEFLSLRPVKENSC